MAASTAAEASAPLSTANIDADLGPLTAFLGTWVGSKGQLIMPVPKQGSNPDSVGAFAAIVKEYGETWTFTALEHGVRNRGGQVDQMVGAVQYEQVVKALDGEKEVLHVENGMLLYLGDFQSPAPDPAPAALAASADAKLVQWPPIARSATIPHGNTCLLYGYSPTTSEGAPSILDDVTSAGIGLAPTNIGTQQPLGYSEPYLKGGHPPNITSLEAALQGQVVNSTQKFVLDTGIKGSIVNIPFINKFAKAVNFKTVFWFEEVQDPADPAKTFTQLQYLQGIDLDFHKPFGPDAKGLIRWPHLLSNTLTIAPA